MIRSNLSVLGKIRCFHLGTRSAWGNRVNQQSKRGAMLVDMITDKDKKKNWHFHILKNPPKSRNVFEKVHKPTRRQNVLNMLFIQNITDVLSTGDIAPEFVGTGIEITGVKISPTCQDLHVYWQIPPSRFESDENFAALLNLKAPKIRAELISRNLMGHVPHIHFVRDTSNAYIAAFEKALKEADFGPENQTSVVPESTFTSKKKKMFTFETAKVNEEKEKIETNSAKVSGPSEPDVPPPKPQDMKSDVFGLNRESLMSKIISLKLVSKSSPNVIFSAQLNEATDLFSNIPGTTLEGNSDRDAVLKQFYVQRKMIRNKKDSQPKTEDHLLVSDYSQNEVEQIEYDDVEEDFIEEDTSERF